MLTLRDVTYSFPDRSLIIGDISLTVGASERLGLLGPSGCGKTTLLRIIAGLINAKGVERLCQPQDVSTMFEQPTLLRWRSALRNVRLPLDVRGDTGVDDRDTMAGDLLNRVGLGDKRDETPEKLSQGQRYRVALARACVTKPKLLLLDEPFSHLDVQTRGVIYSFFDTLAQGCASVLVTHDIDEAFMLCDRIVVLTRRPAGIKDLFDVPPPRTGREGRLQDAHFLDLRKKVRASLLAA